LRAAIGSGQQIVDSAAAPQFMRPRERAVDTMNTLLRVMGRPVESLEEFFDHFCSGQVVVQANGTPDDPTKGHAAFFYKQRIYELKMGPDEYLASTEYKARYPYYKASGGGMDVKYRSFVDVSESKAFSRSAQINHLIDKKRIFVLNAEYSKYFEGAFQKERSNFVRMPYSYGIHYNCNTFALFTVKRMMQLRRDEKSEGKPMLEGYGNYRRSRRVPRIF
jgi:hypothetical protein